MKRTTKRQGFTLVELLIVIVVIGILSAMMMLSSTEAVTSAKASNIVSNLRNIKTAALAYYIDNMESADATDFTISRDAIMKYLNASEKQTVDSNYQVVSTTDGDWYAVYTITGTTSEKNRIQEKLAGRANAVGLCKGDDAAPDKDTKYTKDLDKVAMFVR